MSKNFNFIVLIMMIFTLTSLNAVDLKAKFPVGTILECEGLYPDHVQGVISDGEFIYWSFASTIVKTNLDGQIIKKAKVKYHHGDPCLVDGKIYYPLGCGSWNKELPKNAESKNYVMCYDKDLNFIKQYHVPEVIYGAGCIEFVDGKFYVSGGLIRGEKTIYIYEYSREFKFIKRHELTTPNHIGIQTMKFYNGSFWLGIYPRYCVRTNKNFEIQKIYQYPTTMGLMNLNGTDDCPRFLAIRHIKTANKKENKSKAISVVVKNDVFIQE